MQSNLSLSTYRRGLKRFPNLSYFCGGYTGLENLTYIQSNTEFGVTNVRIMDTIPKLGLRIFLNEERLRVGMSFDSYIQSPEIPVNLIAPSIKYKLIRWSLYKADMDS